MLVYTHICIFYTHIYIHNKNLASYAANKSIVHIICELTHLTAYLSMQQTLVGAGNCLAAEAIKCDK